MKKKFEIENVNNVQEHIVELDNDFYLSIVEKNRDRIRTLAAILLNVNGFILSACFVVIFFFIKEYKISDSIRVTIISGYLLAILFVTLSIVSIILSIYIYRALPVSSKSEMVNMQLKIFKRERKRLNISFIFFTFSIVFFIISLMLTGFLLA